LDGLDLSEPEDLKKAIFLEGVVIAMKAACQIGRRFADRARELADVEENARRKAELKEIAEICNRVPANPARTFHEALQSYYFASFLLVWETAQAVGYSQGRMDQYLWPYYETDIREGRITKEKAQEIIDCYILKLNQASDAGSIGVGGVKSDGSDATNELSYMLIEAMMHTRLLNPYFTVLVHGKTPYDLLIKAAQLTSLGTGHPQYLNSDVMVAQALARGTMGGPSVTLEDARSAANVGCLEVAIPGKDSGYLYIGVNDLASALELALNNGIRRIDGRKTGAETGDPRHFASFQEIQKAYRKQLAHIRGNTQRAGVLLEQKIVNLSPTVYESALIDDCIEKGLCREEGGAHYNFNTGVVASGSTDAGDSLAAIKKLADMIRVFADQKVYHVQINVVSSDTLRAAQKAPKEHRDLVVKVAGYNAFFTQLSKALQDSIIARTEHRLSASNY